MIEPPETALVDRLQWFAGDRDALDLYERLVYVAHAWDDLVDQDKPVDVSKLMANLLLYLPSNPCYVRYQGELRALFMVGMVGYEAANLIEGGERTGHQLELAHYLRYAVMHAAVFLIAALNGIERGAQILATAAPVMLPERLADYLKEHERDRIQPT
jgi:hypothetical protein